MKMIYCDSALNVNGYINSPINLDHVMYIDPKPGECGFTFVTKDSHYVHWYFDNLEQSKEMLEKVLRESSAVNVSHQVKFG